jgi:uncharacterized protein YjbJ (UPF0337 family)
MPDSGKPESAKDAQGRAKEAAGNLTGDKQMQHEGQTEQAGEKAKSAVDKVTERFKGMFGGKK